jgi:hypothetical protein
MILILHPASDTDGPLPVVQCSGLVIDGNLVRAETSTGSLIFTTTGPSGWIWSPPELAGGRSIPLMRLTCQDPGTQYDTTQIVPALKPRKRKNLE